MADMDPELAFLESQKQEYDPAQDYGAMRADGDEEEDEDEEYDPSSAYPAYTAHKSANTPSDQSASMPESTANTPPVAAEGEVKPAPADAAAPTSSKQQQPRTMGGFVVESEDEEDEVPVSEPATGGSALPNANGGSVSPRRSLTHSPLNTHAPTNVPVHSAQALGQSGVSPSASVTVNDTAPIQSPAVPNGSTPVPDATKQHVPDVLSTLSARPSTAPVIPPTAPPPKARLPQDRVGIFEDRIAEDPRGDIEAWLSLIEEYRRRHKTEDARNVYDRFFKVFPTAAEQWNEWAMMELDLEDFKAAERLFERAITSNENVGLWSTYINYTRRIHNVTTDELRARTVITQVYEFVLEKIGIDVAAGRIWQDYIEFIKSGPGNLGGAGGQANWQDQQKMDTLRKVYQRAVIVPTNATLELWRDYDKFEMNYNKNSGRRILQETSPYYVTARGAVHVLDNITKGVNRTTLPKLPPVQGFDGHDEYINQVNQWKNWLQFEKNDPLDIKETNRALYNKRVIYLYKQALMALRFWPELWFEAAEWCFQNDLEQEGNEFLADGIEANPESCLLAFRQAHQIEFKGEFDEGDAGALRKGDAVRAPFDKVLHELYDLTNKTKKREEHSLARAKEAFAAQQAAEEAARATRAKNANDNDDDDDAGDAKRRQEKEEALQNQLQAISAGYNAQIKMLKKTISFAWIALMRAMRRIQGKGSPTPAAGTGPGFRGIFAEARKKGKLLSDAYVASALIEHHCYQDAAATKIFDRGMKLFPDDENFALEYIQHLIKQNDATNARAVFETVVNRLTQKDESKPRAKSLFVFFHEYETQFGDLASIMKLEKRMEELFPADPQLTQFSKRYSAPTFDPTVVRPIISPKTQMKPVMMNIVPTVEEPVAPPPQVQEVQATPMINSPQVHAALLPITNSPKRPLDEADNESAQPRKLMRGESPLKGAAGRRLDAARRNMGRASEGVPNQAVAPPPQDLAREIKFLISIIPGAHHFENVVKFSPEKMVALLQATDLGRANLNRQTQHQAPTPVPYGAPVAQPPAVNHWGVPPQAGMGGYYGH